MTGRRAGHPAVKPRISIAVIKLSLFVQDGEVRNLAMRAAKVGELVAETAAGSNEQAQGIDQMNKAVAEMDKVVQQNAPMPRSLPAPLRR